MMGCDEGTATRGWSPSRNHGTVARCLAVLWLGVSLSMVVAVEGRRPAIAAVALDESRPAVAEVGRIVSLAPSVTEILFALGVGALAPFHEPADAP